MLKAFRPAEAKAGDWAFRGQVPRVPTFKRDLTAAGIPFEDERGRRVDLHALRTTFGTLLSASGVSPRVAMGSEARSRERSFRCLDTSF